MWIGMRSKVGAKLLPAGDKLRISKFVSGFCATASQMCYSDAKKKDENQEDYDKDYTKRKNDRCPMCKTERETSAHVLHCTHKRATRNRCRQIRDLSTWFDLQHTDPIISSCIIQTLESSHEHNFYDSMVCLTSDEVYLQCALSQDAIGRTNFGFGGISKQWRTLQRDYLLREYSKTKFSADAWVKRLISKIYKMAQNLWRYRCARVHGSDTKKLSKRKRKALRKEIKDRYFLGPDGVRASERNMLDIPLSEILRYTTRRQQYWLQTIQASRKYKTERDKNMYIGMRDVLRRWAFVPD